MSKVCDDKNVPETKRGAGPCEIVSEVKKRNGKPNWWCRTHSSPASAPDGAALPACPGSWFDAVPDDKRLLLDLSHGESAIWGALSPALVVGEPPPESGKVHVHRRPSSGAGKDLDGSFDIVTVVNGDNEVVVEGMAAVAYSLSELARQPLVALVCPRCGGSHIDEEMFATHPHKKHLCNHCGRNFSDTTGPTVSNPLADIYSQLDLERPLAPVPATRSITLNRDEYSCIAMWPSNAAIVSTMTRPEEVGIHVHAWDRNSVMVLDETYGAVELDGDTVDLDALRWLAVQVALAHGSPIISLECSECGEELLSPTSGWIRAGTTHACACGAETRTRRRVFVNPLADKDQ